MTPRYVHVPWIAAQGEALTADLAATGDVAFAPLRLFPEGDDAARRDLLSLAEINPAALAQAIRRRLRALGGVAHGMLLTHDWPAPMRVLARIAAAAGLPTVLVPHESVHFARARFWRDVRGPAVAPVCDLVLGWGAIHAETFLARGLPAERLRLVGSPKLDRAARWRPRIDAAAARAALGAPADRPFALFAMQPMDNAVDPARARRMQLAAVADLAAACEAAGAALIARPPPGGAADATAGLAGAARLAPPGGGPDLLDLMAHAALVASVGSTALVEARLMGRPTLQVDYDPEATGAELRLAPDRAADPQAAREACAALLAAGDARADPALDAFHDRAFSPGRIADGGAAARIAAALRTAARPVRLDALPPAGPIDRVAAFRLMRRLGLPRRGAARLA
jgi:hypothetical protein